jgi:hypothetical protein
MDPDELKHAWQSQPPQTRLTTDAEVLLGEVQRDARHFNTVIFWRDVREVGVSLLMVPLWIYLGIKSSLPWTWYLMLPGLMWIAGYLLVDRMQQRRQRPGLGEPLRRWIESSLAQLEHQIGLLRNVLYWYLLPLALPMFAFFAQSTWRMRVGGWWMTLGLAIVIVVVVLAFAGIYWLNHYAVRATLEPRRRELQLLLASLADEAHGAS